MLPQQGDFLINALLLALNHSSQTRRTPANTHLRLHRNWLGAALFVVRSFSVLAAVGLLWLYTGWSFLPFMMLGLSVMLSIFASFENPAWFMRYVTLGQVMGASCRVGMHVVGVATCSQQLANGVVDVAIHGQLRVHLCPQTQHARLV